MDGLLSGGGLRVVVEIIVWWDITTNATYKQTLPAPERGPQPAGGQPGIVGPVGFKLD